MDYGLIGHPLKHSFSKEIHSLISNYTYTLCDLEQNEFDFFMTQKDFKGINVTIPYKQKVIPYLDYIDSAAKSIDAVNTIINCRGKLFGFNTDIYGVLATFSHFNIDLNNKNVLILGTGATSNTIYHAIRESNANAIYKAYRQESHIKGDILYDDIYKISDKIDFIINATSNGMFPHNEDKELIDLAQFKHLLGVMDVIYNPLRTKFLQSAELYNVKSISGLYMLVAQAYYASKLFLNNNFNSENLITNSQKTSTQTPLAINNNLFDIKNIEKQLDNIYNNCKTSKQNIVLIGMPTSGKTTIGRKISEKYSYEFIDTDKLIEERIQSKISDFIDKNGEGAFRNIESDIISDISVRNHTVIATGGGSILRDKNIANLKYNGKIFFINKPLSELKPSNDRPLTRDIDNLTKKYYERLPIYKNVCDNEIDGMLDDDAEIDAIVNNL